MSENDSSDRTRKRSIQLNRALYWISRHWLLVVTAAGALFVGIPWLAPLFMKLGWTDGGRIIYLLYSPLCHQMPQRSFFLFGQQPMYSMAEIQPVWPEIADLFALRRFVGSDVMGWKVAWSDRMVSMYGGIVFWGMVYGALRRRMKPLRWWWAAALLAPMLLDGLSHMVSDVMGGVAGGFRYSNTWLAQLTGGVFGQEFYVGDKLGSFNSWMRLISGLLFGLAAVWMIYPYLNAEFARVGRQIAAKFEKAGLAL